MHTWVFRSALASLTMLLGIVALFVAPQQRLSAQEQFADLVIEVIDAPDPVRVLEQLTSTIIVRNLGPGTAQGVVVEDTQPVSSAFGFPPFCQGGVTDRISCALADIPSGGQIEFDITVTVDRLTVASADNGNISNSATVISDSTSRESAVSFSCSIL